MKDFKLPHAAVVIALLAFLTFLTWKGIDSAPIAVGLTAAIGAMGWMIKNQGEQGAQATAIQATVNGNNDKLLKALVESQLANQQQHAESIRQMRQLADKLAEMVPPSAVPTVITVPADAVSITSAGEGS